MPTQRPTFLATACTSVLVSFATVLAALAASRNFCPIPYSARLPSNASTSAVLNRDVRAIPHGTTRSSGSSIVYVSHETTLRLIRSMSRGGSSLSTTQPSARQTLMSIPYLSFLLIETPEFSPTRDPSFAEAPPPFRAKVASGKSYRSFAIWL